MGVRAEKPAEADACQFGVIETHRGLGEKIGAEAEGQTEKGEGRRRMKEHYISIHELKKDMEKENIKEVLVVKMAQISHWSGWSEQEVFKVVGVDFKDAVKKHDT